MKVATKSAIERVFSRAASMFNLWPNMCKNEHFSDFVATCKLYFVLYTPEIVLVYSKTFCKYANVNYDVSSNVVFL